MFYGDAFFIRILKLERFRLPIPPCELQKLFWQNRVAELIKFTSMTDL